MASPTRDVASQLRDTRIIWKRSPGDVQLREGSIVITVPTVKMYCPSEVRLARVRPQTKGYFHRGIGQRQSRCGMINSQEVELIMCVGQLVLREKERWIAGHSLIQQINRLPQTGTTGATKAR